MIVGLSNARNACIGSPLISRLCVSVHVCGRFYIYVYMYIYIETVLVPAALSISSFFSPPFFFP
jgi:hypothetical protein